VEADHPVTVVAAAAERRVTAVANPETRIEVPAVAAHSLLPGHYRHSKLRQDSIAMKSRFHPSASAVRVLEF
jgi:hypothetical protein